MDELHESETQELLLDVERGEHGACDVGSTGDVALKNWVVRVIPPARSIGAEMGHLVAAMHSLALDERTPLALELVGTSEQRSFLLRATSQMSLEHAVTQLRAHYPQAQFRAVSADDDPFVCHPCEHLAALELTAGAAAYLPLQSWSGDRGASAHSEPDPLLGVLGALDALPTGARLISQLAIVPAPIGWSRHDQRKAIEHALEPERQQMQRSLAAQRLPESERAPNLSLLLLGVVVLVGIIGFPHWKAWLPAPVFNQVTAFAGWITTPHDMRRGMPGVSGMPSALSLPWVLGLGGLGIAGLFFLGGYQRRRRHRMPLYDQALVAQKTSRMAYRVRFRLYAIGSPAAFPASLATERWWSPFFLSLARFRVLVVLHRQQRVFLARLVAAYRQYHLAAGNYFVPRRLSQRQAKRCIQGGSGLLLPAGGWWSGVKRSQHVISVETLAALWHLPAVDVLPDLALVEQTVVRTLPVPLSLLQAIESEAEDQTEGMKDVGALPLGIAEHAGHRFPVTLPTEMLTKHLLIAGKSGEGKSTCLEYLACRAMEQGGVVVIDPHGDLVEHILALVPEQRIPDVVLIDLADEQHVIGFNPLDASLGRGRDKAIADLLKTLAHIWASSWGSRMENAFEYALRTLFEANRAWVKRGEPQHQYTLLDVMLVLTDESFYHALLEQIDDPFILRWWHLYYDPLNPVMQRERSDPVLSKVAKFESVLARRIVGQATTTVNLAECIQREQIVLVKLAKGVVGDDVARLLGATLLGLLQITLEEQGALEVALRKHLSIIIDEFQVLQGVDWAALAELRKYGAAFTLATQSLGYLADRDAALLDIVLANVKQYIIFHLSAKDAQTMHEELGVAVDDILSLASYMCYVKLVALGRRQPTFSMTLLPPALGDLERAVRIRQANRQCYTVPAAEVDVHLRTALAASLLLLPQSEENWGTTQSHTDPIDGIAHPTPAMTRPRLHESSDGTLSVDTSTTSTVTLARQHHGYRGRKSEEKKGRKSSGLNGTSSTNRTNDTNYKGS